MFKYLSLITLLLLSSTNVFAKVLPKHRTAMQVSYQVEVPEVAHGSGFALTHYKGGTIFITNDHVCQATRGKTLFTKALIRGPLNSVKPFVIDINGNRFPATVVKTTEMITRSKNDPAADLCALWVKGYLAQIASLTDENAEVGEEVFSVSGPLGIFPILHRGFMGPILKQRAGSEYLPPSTSSLMVTHGSSGGAVFNTDGEVVGVIFAFIPGDESPGVTLVVTRDQVYSFAEEYLRIIHD